MPSDLVDTMPARLWLDGNLCGLFDEDVHFCGDGTRTIEFGDVDIGGGNAEFLGYEDDVVNEPVTRAAADALLRFVALVAGHLSREVKFTPESAATATWLTRDIETGAWVEDSLDAFGAGGPIQFKILDD